MAIKQNVRAFVEATANYFSRLEFYQDCTVELYSTHLPGAYSILGMELLNIDIKRGGQTVDKFVFYFDGAGDIDEVWVYGINKHAVADSCRRSNQLWGLGVGHISTSLDHVEISISDTSALCVF